MHNMDDAFADVSKCFRTSSGPAIVTHVVVAQNASVRAKDNRFPCCSPS